jgi:hypothetical protein
LVRWPAVSVLSVLCLAGCFSVYLYISSGDEVQVVFGLGVLVVGFFASLILSMWADDRTTSLAASGITLVYSIALLTVLLPTIGNVYADSLILFVATAGVVLLYPRAVEMPSMGRPLLRESSIAVVFLLPVGLAFAEALFLGLRFWESYTLGKPAIALVPLLALWGYVEEALFRGAVQRSLLPLMGARGAILGAAVLVSGCLAVTMSTTVDGNGKITDVTTELNLSQTNYDLFASLIQMSSPGTDMKTYFVENYSKSYGGPGTKVDYSERKSNGYVYITLDAHGTDVIPEAGSNISVTKEGDYWVYRYLTTGAESAAGVPSDVGSLGDALDNAITMDFYVTMPGKIVDSNADKVNGNKAEWHYNLKTLRNVSSIYAKSEVTKSPGFEAAAALLALVAGICLFGMRKKK